MDQPPYEHQTTEPLYPKVIWNRPVARHGAGRLLVIGGYLGDFSLPTSIYGLALAAGVGECTVALPDSLLKFLAGTPATTFVSSSQSGSLGRDALGQLLELGDEADAIAIGAGLSNNSETATLVERLLQELDRPVIAFADSLIALQFNIKLLIDRANALIILTMPELFKLAGQLAVPIHIRRDGGLINKLEIVRAVKAEMAADLVVYGAETIVAQAERMSVTPTNPVLSRLSAAYYAVLSVFWLQNQGLKFEGLTTAAWILHQAALELKQQETPTVVGLSKAIGQALTE
jgi:NAD(P)H-hydrate repair Nnr-like enzyme with NAD(P)H-hydrate dehydratase domain